MPNKKIHAIAMPHTDISLNRAISIKKTTSANVQTFNLARLYANAPNNPTTANNQIHPMNFFLSLMSNRPKQALRK